MTKQLIDGLRTAADWIESGKVRYNWYNGESCNCGILAQAVLNVTEMDICNEYIYHQWNKEVSRGICKQTGLHVNEIIRELLKIGMKPSDFVNLEYLTFEGVKPEISKHSHYADAKNVISYMRTWADSLERELLNQSTKAKTTIKVTVSC
jgi:hypothetical protein